MLISRWQFNVNNNKLKCIRSLIEWILLEISTMIQGLEKNLIF